MNRVFNSANTIQKEKQKLQSNKSHTRRKATEQRYKSGTNDVSDNKWNIISKRSSSEADALVCNDDSHRQQVYSTANECYMIRIRGGMCMSLFFYHTFLRRLSTTKSIVLDSVFNMIQNRIRIIYLFFLLNCMNFRHVSSVFLPNKNLQPHVIHPG